MSEKLDRLEGRAKKKYKRWSPSELKFIEENSHTMNDTQVAAKLSQLSDEVITSRMVNVQRKKLGIKRTKGRPKREDNLRHATHILEPGIEVNMLENGLNRKL